MYRFKYNKRFQLWYRYTNKIKCLKEQNEKFHKASKTMKFYMSVMAIKFVENPPLLL